VCTKNLVYIWYSIGSRAGVWGGSQIGGRQEGLHLLCLRQSLGVTPKWLPFVGQKVAIFVGRTMRFLREKTQFESALYH